MILVKKQGRYEVFSRGVEEPWSIWRDGKPHRQVWTWPEVDEVLREEAPTKNSRGHATKRTRRSAGLPKLTARELEALDSIRLGDAYDQQIGEHLEKQGLVYWMGGALYITSEGRAALTRGVLRAEAPKRAHARKSKAQRDRELAEERERSQRWLVTFQVPGSPWVYLAATGSGTMDPDAAVDFGSRSAAEARAAAMQGPRSSLRAKVTSRSKA